MVTLNKKNELSVSKSSVLSTRGITLIELLIAMSLLTLIISVAGSMMIFSNKSQATVQIEYQIQSDMRLASEKLNQEIRYSSAVFMMNENQYRNSGDLKSDWNYVALCDDKTEIVQYIWNDSTGLHDKKVLVHAQDGILYGLSFKGVISDSKLVHFKLDGFTSGSTDSKVSVSTTLNAVNSAVVDDSGTNLAPSLALAYRADDIPDPDKVTVAVTMVLDKSGSMGYQMGGIGNGSTAVRMQVMKEKAKALIDIFAEMNNVYISLVPFSTNANNPGNFLNASTNKSALKNAIDGLNANGGTNAGDGIRRSYYQHVDFNNSKTEQVINYTIVLMDGNPTFWPSTNGSNSYYGTGNISDSTSLMGGNGSSTIQGSMDYIKNFSNSYIKINNHTQAAFLKTFVIGFTGVSEEVERAEEIAQYHNHPTDSRIKGMYYAATNSEELEQVFTSIADYILRETWHIYGPLP